jgi:hypothetical protein
VATIEQRRKTDRERRERWRKRKLSEGNKQIQVMITPEAQKVLKLEKDRSGEPFVQIINRAIMNIGKTHPSISEKTAPPSGKSAKTKERARTSDKTTAHSPEQLSLFLGSEN